jgi:CheY-like chemotaxis protein
VTQVPTVQVASPWRSRSDVEVVCQQLDAIERFHHRRHAAQCGAAGGLTREGRLDAARAREVLEREHEALVAHVDRQLAATGEPWRSRAPRRVVVAHRSAWFAGKVGEALGRHGVRVVAQLDNGADAIGVALAEQPDLVLVEDALPMVPGPRVVAEIRELCPDAVLAAQVDHPGRIAVLLDAGATTAFVRRQPPADVAAELLALMRPADQL